MDGWIPQSSRHNSDTVFQKETGRRENHPKKRRGRKKGKRGQPSSTRFAFLPRRVGVGAKLRQPGNHPRRWVLHSQSAPPPCLRWQDWPPCPNPRRGKPGKGLGRALGVYSGDHRPRPILDAASARRRNSSWGRGNEKPCKHLVPLVVLAASGGSHRDVRAIDK